MNKQNKLDPIQYFRNGVWFEIVVPLIKTNPRVKAELLRIGTNYLECMESVLEPDLSAEDLAEEMRLLDHEFRVRQKDFHWLRSHFSSFDLANLSLVLAAEIFPDKTWEFVERDDDVVLIDADRSMVLDLPNCYELSALASLALCGDPGANQNPKAVEEMNRYRERKNSNLEASLATMREHVAQFSKKGTVLNFPES